MLPTTRRSPTPPHSRGIPTPADVFSTTSVPAEMRRIIVRCYARVLQRLHSGFCLIMAIEKGR